MVLPMPHTSIWRCPITATHILTIYYLLATCACEGSSIEHNFSVEARQTRTERQEYFLDVLSGKDMHAGSNGGAPFSGEEDNEPPINPARIAELNSLVGKRDIFQSLKPEHMEAVQKCIALLQEREYWKDILIRASELREQINIQLWINAVLETTIYSPTMAGLYKPALIELSPDRFLPGRIIERAINQSGSVQRQDRTCTLLDESTGANAVNGIENALWYFREDIQVNAQHWYWHVSYPTRLNQNPLPPSHRRGELFYFFHESMLARYNSERLSNNFPLVVPLKAVTANEVVEEGYTSYLTSINSGFAPYGSRRPNHPISYASNQPFLTNVYSAIDSKGLRNGTTGKIVDLQNLQGIELLGNAVESSAAYSINLGLYGSVHNNGHNLIANLTEGGRGVMVDTTTSMRDIVFYRWHIFINDIFERHKFLLPEYSATGGDVPLVWSGIQVTGLQVNSGSATPANNLKTYWSQRKFDISRGLDLRRPFSWGRPVPVCIKHLNHNPFSYTINITKQSPGSQRASIRIFLGPRYNTVGVRFSMEEQRKLIFILDTFSATLNPGTNVVQRASADSSVTKPWSKTFDELENDNSPSTPQCGCGWPEHLLLPKGKESGMVYDLFVLVTNGVDDSAGPLGEQSGTCSQPYHYCGIRNQEYPDRKPMGFPFDRRAPFLSSGRRVANLDEFTGLVPNSRTVQVTITHVNQMI